jgi:hypothetical protein
MDGELERLPIGRMILHRMRALRDWRSWYRRPYGDWRPLPVATSTLETVRRCGFGYAISKTAFGWPTVLASGDGFVALNHTAGVWEGWSPFVDVRGIEDLLTAECRLLHCGRPGWLLGSLDACLWGFSYHQWERGAELKDMAQLLREGGESGRILNVTPEVLARYARILGVEGHVRSLAS